MSVMDASKEVRATDVFKEVRVTDASEGVS